MTPSVSAEGFALVDLGLTPEILEELGAAADRILASSPAGTRWGGREPSLVSFGFRGAVAGRAREVLGKAARPVGLTVFDKSPAAN